jgi:hypothetical protein
MLYLDGVYDKQGIFYPVKSPAYQDIENIAQKIAARVSRYLEKSGYLIRDLDTEYLDLNTDENEASYCRVRGPPSDYHWQRTAMSLLSSNRLIAMAQRMLSCDIFSSDIDEYIDG